jgi:hypothetical protein
MKSIYDVPCPKAGCGSKIVSTARVMDDAKAPTTCASGHTFMRSEARKKDATKAFYETLRNDLGQGAVVVNASARLVSATRMVIAERLQEYVKRLKKLGIKQLGSGNFADVFQHPTMPNVVVKLLTEHDRGYEAYVKFAQKNKSNKYVPRILQVVDADKAFDKKGEYDMGDLRLIFMEKLEPIHYNKYIDFGEHVVDCAGIKAKKGEHINVEKALMDLATWKACAAQTKDKDLAAVAKFVVKTEGGPVQLDMHDGNMMMRGSQVIITDPFSTYD